MLPTMPTDSREMNTMDELAGSVGFDHPIAGKTFLSRRIVAVELMATAALAVSLVVAVTAVSIGIARADTLRTFTDGERGPFAVALFFGLVMAAMGGLTAVMARGAEQARD
jgi:hypothetical protein